MSRMPAEIASSIHDYSAFLVTIASVAIFIAVATAVMIRRMLPIGEDSERIEKDWRFRARKLRGGAILYGCSLLFGIVSVIRGDNQA